MRAEWSGKKMRAEKNTGPRVVEWRVWLYLTPEEKRVIQDAALRAWPPGRDGYPRSGLAVTALVRYAIEMGTFETEDIRSLALNRSEDRLTVRRLPREEPKRKKR